MEERREVSVGGGGGGGGAGVMAEVVVGGVGRVDPVGDRQEFVVVDELLHNEEVTWAAGLVWGSCRKWVPKDTRVGQNY
jgi:hypothetical protein